MQRTIETTLSHACYRIKNTLKFSEVKKLKLSAASCGESSILQKEETISFMLACPAASSGNVLAGGFNQGRAPLPDFNIRLNGSGQTPIDKREEQAQIFRQS